MEQEELTNSIRYLLTKYLEKDRAKFVLADFEKTQDEGQYIGKEILHILTVEKAKEFENSDKDLLKEVAFNLGI